MANYRTILVVDDNTSIFTTLEICPDELSQANSASGTSHGEFLCRRAAKRLLRRRKKEEDTHVMQFRHISRAIQPHVYVC